MCILDDMDVASSTKKGRASSKERPIPRELCSKGIAKQFRLRKSRIGGSLEHECQDEQGGQMVHIRRTAGHPILSGSFCMVDIMGKQSQNNSSHATRMQLRLTQVRSDQRT